jgi:hypothetical protein
MKYVKSYMFRHRGAIFRIIITKLYKVNVPICVPLLLIRMIKIHVHPYVFQTICLGDFKNNDTVKCYRYVDILLTCIIIYQYSETNVIHILLNVLRIKGLYMFRALLAHHQEALDKRHLVYCVRVISVGCTMIIVEVYLVPLVGRLLRMSK